MTQWKQPPIIKLYEALGAIGDGRVEHDDNEAKVWSSSRGKHYDVHYDPDEQAIMTNDNGSYWQGYLGYPALAFLLDAGVVKYDPSLAERLKGFAWKDINVKFKNDWAKTEQLVLEELVRRDPQLDQGQMRNELEHLLNKIMALKLSMLGSKQRPPSGY